MDNLTVCKTVLKACEKCSHDIMMCLGSACKNFTRAVYRLHDYEDTGLVPDEVQALKRERFESK